MRVFPNALCAGKYENAKKCPKNAQKVRGTSYMVGMMGRLSWSACAVEGDWGWTNMPCATLCLDTVTLIPPVIPHSKQVTNAFVHYVKYDPKKQFAHDNCPRLSAHIQANTEPFISIYDKLVCLCIEVF